MISTKKKLMIFDYDGTIADTSPIHERAFQDILNPLKIKFNYSDYAGQRSFDVIKNCFHNNNQTISDSKVLNLVEKKQFIFRKIIKDKIKPIKGADEFIKYAFSKYHLCIASSGSKINILNGLEILNLSKYFNEIICAEDVQRAKPDPEIFNKTISLTKFTNEEALIFEDSNSGILAAQRAKIDYIDIRNLSFENLLFEIKK